MECVPSSDVLSRVPGQFDYCASPVCLSTGDVVGLSFTAQVGFISAISVVGLLGYVAINHIKIVWNPAKPPRRLIRTNIDGLMLNLLIADLIMSLGAIINIHWAMRSQVSCGQACNTQGAIQILGETSVALFTLAITLLTFISVVRGWAIKAQSWVWGVIVVGVWTFGALWAGIGETLEGFYAPTPYWCWISKEYKSHRIGAEYVWLWISGFGSILLYTPLFLLLRGNIKWDPTIGWASFRWSWKGDNMTSSNKLLWYPLAYTITILPLSIVRWITFSGGQVGAAASFAAVSIFNLSGVVNVGLILLTRTNVLGLDYGSPRAVRPQSAGNLLPGGDSVREDSTGFGGVRVLNRRDSSIMEQGVDRMGEELDPTRSSFDFSSFVAAGMPTASMSKPGKTRIPTVGGSRIPTIGGSKIPSLGGRSATAGKAPANEKQELSIGKKRGLALQKESPNPKARKVLRTANAPAAGTLKPNNAPKPAQPTAQKRALASPPTSARKRQRLELPLRSSARLDDPLDVIPPTPPRASQTENSIRARSPPPPPPLPCTQERARSTTAFNIPLGDQSSLLGGTDMDISSAGLYSDFENERTPSPKSEKTTRVRETVNRTRRQSAASARRSSITPKPRQESSTPRRPPKSTRRASATPRRYEPKTLPPPVVIPTAMQAKKEARLAEAQAKLAAAWSEVKTGPAPNHTMTSAEARIAAAQAEAERRLRMSVDSADNEGLSVVQEESYVEGESDRDDRLEEEQGEHTEVEGEQEEGEEEHDEEEEGEDEDTLQLLHDEDEGSPATREAWSSQTKTPKASTSTTPRAWSRGTTTPAFRPTATPATRPTTTPAYKFTTTPATAKPTTATPATSSYKGKSKYTLQDTPDPAKSDTPSEYAPDEYENAGECLPNLPCVHPWPGVPSIDSLNSATRLFSSRLYVDYSLTEDVRFYQRRPSLGFSLSQLSLHTPHQIPSKKEIKEILRDEGEIASRTRSRRASGDGTRRESLAGAMTGLKLNDQNRDFSIAVRDEEEEEEGEEGDEEGDETVRRHTTTPRASGYSYSTTPRNLPSTTPRNKPSTTPGNTSTTPRNDPFIAGSSTTPFYPPSTTPADNPSATKRKLGQPHKLDSPTRGRGKGRARGRGRGSRGGVSPTHGGDISRADGENISPESGRLTSPARGGTSPTRGRGMGQGRGRSQSRRPVSRDGTSMYEETFAEGQTQQSTFGDRSVSSASRQAEQDSTSEWDGQSTRAGNRTAKPKSPMKVEVVIPQASAKSISKTPRFKPGASTPLFKPTSSVSSFQPSAPMGSSKPESSASQHSGSTLSSRSKMSTSSVNPTTASSRHSLSTSTSVFNSPTKIMLQQPTPELSSLDRSPGSHQDMMTDTSLGSRQHIEHIDQGGDMSVSLGYHHESNGSHSGSTSSRQYMDEPSTSQQDQDMDLIDEVPETSLSGTPFEQRGASKLPSQSSFSHLLDRDMIMRSERTATMRMETSQRNMTVHADISQRSATLSRSTSTKSHTPAAKKQLVPKKTPGLKILPDSQASRLNAFTPRVPLAPADDSIEFTPASRFDFNESHMEFEDTPATGVKFVQSTPFVRNGAHPSLGLSTLQNLHLDDSMEDEEISDSQAGSSDSDSQVDQPERTETTPRREISVAVSTSSPNRSLRTQRVPTPRAPRLSNPVDDEEDEDEPELPPSPSAGRSNFQEGNSLPDGNGINGRRLSDILMLRAKQARDRGGDVSRDQSGGGEMLGVDEMTRLSDQSNSLLRRSSGSKLGSVGDRSRTGNNSNIFGTSTSSNLLGLDIGHVSQDHSSFETSRDRQEQVQDYDASVRFDGPSGRTRRSGTPVFRHSSQHEESDEGEVSSIPDQPEEGFGSSGGSVTSPVPSDQEEELEPEDDEEMDYDENGEPIIKISGPPEALVQAKSALIQLGYVEDEERMEEYSRIRSSRSRSRSISRAGDSTRNISIGSSPRGHLGDRTTGLSRSQMMAEASRYEDWEPPSRHQLRPRKWAEHDWRMLAHYMRRVQKSQALMKGLSSRQELDLKRVDIPTVVQRFVEEEAHGIRLEGEWDRSEIAGRVEFLIKTEGYKKDGSWRSTLANITAPGFSTQKTLRYEPEPEASPEVESPAKGRMLPATLSERPGPARIAVAQVNVPPNPTRVIQKMIPASNVPKQLPQPTRQATRNTTSVCSSTRRPVQNSPAKPTRYRPRREPEDMSLDQPSAEPSVQEPEEPSEQQPVEELSIEELPEEPHARRHSVEDELMEEQYAEEPPVEEPSVEEPVSHEVDEEIEEGVGEEEGEEVEEQVEEQEEVEEQGGEGGEAEEGEDPQVEEFGEEEQDPPTQDQTYEVALSASPARTRSPPKSRRYLDGSIPTNRGLEVSMRSAGAPPTPIARFFGTISSYISGRPQKNQTGEPSMPILKPISRDPIDLIDDGEDEPIFPVLNHVPTPIRPTPARRNRQKRVESRIDIPALQHISPPRPTKEPTRSRPRIRRVGSVKELTRSFELMEEKSREEAEIARSIGARRVVSESNKPRLIPAQVHYVAPSAPVQLNRPKVPPKPARNEPTVPLLPAVPTRAAPAPSTRKTLKQPTRTRPSRPSTTKKRVVPKKEVEVITISDTES
ncbi:unnamed protein product [Rhizoctonia solani]|uniref:Glucose receptor Git3 N-terminal domain-containing protein n=1 Tax=Rhizoctonia solani TaxID=456999 RepID=A0A8H3GY54_9AGAM|nr:unnamed protein product [Rhizoctonia solani]